MNFDTSYATGMADAADRYQRNALINRAGQFELEQAKIAAEQERERQNYLTGMIQNPALNFAPTQPMPQMPQVGGMPPQAMQQPPQQAQIPRPTGGFGATQGYMQAAELQRSIAAEQEKRVMLQQKAMFEQQQKEADNYEKRAKNLTDLIAKGDISPENAQKMFKNFADSMEQSAKSNPQVASLKMEYDNLIGVGSKKQKEAATKQVTRYNEKGELEYGHYEGKDFILEDTGKKPVVAGGSGATDRSYSAGVGDEGQYVVRKADGSLWQPDGKGGQVPYKGKNVYQMKEGLSLSAPDKQSTVKSGDSAAVVAATGKGLSKSLEKQEQNIAAMGAFSKKMDYQNQKIKNIADKIKTSDIRLFNEPINWYNGRIVGDVNRNKFKLYAAELEAEAGKLAIGNPQSISNLPVSTQEKWGKIHDGSLSMKELVDLFDETVEAAKLNVTSAKEERDDTRKRLNELGGGRKIKPVPIEKRIFELKKIPKGDRNAIQETINMYGKDEAEKILTKAWGKN